MTLLFPSWVKVLDDLKRLLQFTFICCYILFEWACASNEQQRQYLGVFSTRYDNSIKGNGSKKKKKPQRNLIRFVSSLDWFLPNKRSTSKVSDVRDPAMTVNHLFWPLNLSHLNAQSLNISCSRNIIIEKSTKYRIVSFRWKERQISKEGGT